MLVPEAVKLRKKRWALVYPNYEYGQSAVAAFKQLLLAAQPDAVFVTEQAAPLGKVDAGFNRLTWLALALAGMTLTFAALGVVTTATASELFNICLSSAWR